MKLSKEDIALLDADPRAFLVTAYFAAHPDSTTRAAAAKLGLSETSVRRKFGAKSGARNGAESGAAKPACAKGSLVVGGAKSGARNGAESGAKITSLTSLLKPIFEARYREHTRDRENPDGFEFMWSAKEMKALKDLGRKIAVTLESKGSPNGDEDVAKAFPLFLGCITDPWILSHFSPSIINSKYNDIISSYSQRKRGIRGASEKRAANADALAEMRAAADSVLNGGRSPEHNSSI